MKIYNVIEDDKIKKLVNNSTLQEQPIHRWMYLKESYSNQIIDYIINKYKKNNIKKILDPFMGAGTTLVQGSKYANILYGFDVNPIACMISKVKTTNYDINKLKLILKTILELNVIHANYKEWEPMQKYIKQDTLDVLEAINNKTKKIQEEKYRFFFKIALVSIFDVVCDYKKDGNGIKYRTSKISSKDILQLYKLKINQMIDDISNQKYLNCDFNIIHDSSMNIEKYPEISDIDIVVTSPPYVNLFDYFEVYKMELWLGDFISNRAEWKKLKHMAMRSNLNSKLNFEEELPMSSILSEIQILLKEKYNEGALKDKRILTVVNNYFKDMEVLLTSLYKKMSNDSIIAIVVGNSAYGGVVVPTDEIFAEIGENIGLKLEQITKARDLRTSSQQMNIINDKTKLRESIIVFRKE